MITKTRTRSIVEFYAASPRLAHAYRSAAKHCIALTRGAELRELLADGPRGGGRSAEVDRVILSHADDDPHVFADARAEAVVAAAFHLLFTEPSTHPEQVAQWMRTTKIRSEGRLHVVQVEGLEVPRVSHLLGRLRGALGRDGSRAIIVDAYLSGNTFLVRGPKYRMLHVSIDALAELKDRPREEVRNFAIDPDGSFIHWPDLDIHLGWNQFLQAVDPVELRKTQQRSAGFNERYGAAIREVRAAAGISQAKVEGLTERQLRRIERGECRATTRALRALARAHGLDTNVYMEKLALAMR
jgi:hypothetical protein